jgi:hypothetical protein
VKRTEEIFSSESYERAGDRKTLGKTARGNLKGAKKRPIRMRRVCPREFDEAQSEN